MVGIKGLSGEERCLCRIESEGVTDAGIYFSYLLTPIGFSIIRLALMKQNALDSAFLLSQFTHFDKATKGIIVVFLTDILKPICVASDVGILEFIHIELDFCASYSYIYDSNLYILGQFLYESASEIVSWSQSCVLSAKRWNGFIPITFGTISAEIDGCHHLKASGNAAQVL